MDITEFTIRLLLLFFPGIICSYIIDTFTIHKPRQAVTECKIQDSLFSDSFL